MTKIGLAILAFVALAMQRSNSQECAPCNNAFIFPGDNVSQYAISRGLEKELTEISACLWLNIPASYVIDTDHAPTMLSYACSSAGNEFVIWVVKGDLACARRDRAFGILANIADGKNHHVCVTWDLNDGPLGIYVDGTNRLKATEATATPIPPGGIWIVGQDQDYHPPGGGFSMKGLLAEVNVFDRILCPYEVAALASSCSPFLKGNIKSQNDFEGAGGLKVIKPSCCLD